MSGPDFAAFQAEALDEGLERVWAPGAVLAEAVDIMQATGSVEYARAYAENLTNTAKGRLVEKVGPSLSRDLLISMADWFVNRLK